MPKQANREDMLREWAKLAPEECEINSTEPLRALWQVVQVQEERPRWCALPQIGCQWYISDSVEFRAILLLAVIEAVRARGWVFDLDVQGEVSLVTVTYDLEAGFAEGEESGEAKEPCDAALAGYVSAIEAAASSETLAHATATKALFEEEPPF